MQDERGAREATRQGRGGSILRDVLACILPILSLGAGLAVAVVVFRHVDTRVTAAQTDLADAEQQAPVVAEQQEVYAGVADPWNSAGTFTTGNAELDLNIKNYCDEHATQGAAVREQAAQATYEAIVQSTYVDRYDTPSGLDWVARSASEFFSYLSADEDEYAVAQGDYYTFAAVTALCLRYFGYSDAIAVPVLYDMDSGEQYGSALCLVTNTDGVSSVCDPSRGTLGWMLNRSSYNILVQDIGQNLDTVEALGLPIQRENEDASEDADGQGDESDYDESDYDESEDDYETGGSYGTGAYDDDQSEDDSYSSNDDAYGSNAYGADYDDEDY